MRLYVLLNLFIFTSWAHRLENVEAKMSKHIGFTKNLKHKRKNQQANSVARGHIQTELLKKRDTGNLKETKQKININGTKWAIYSSDPEWRIFYSYYTENVVLRQHKHTERETQHNIHTHLFLPHACILYFVCQRPGTSHFVRISKWMAAQVASIFTSRTLVFGMSTRACVCVCVR